MGRFDKVRAIALDMDQTIIDFSGSRAAALDAVVARANAEGYRVDRTAFLSRHKQLTDEEDWTYVKTGAWRPSVERFRILCKEFGMPYDGYAEAVTEFYNESRFAALKQYPETPEALTWLKGRYPLFLVTNGPPAPQNREIQVTNVAPYFQRTFVCEEHGLRKPDPRMFELVRAAAGVAPSEMMMVGDFWEADIDTPRKLGWSTVWVVREDDRRARADASKADAVVRSVGELPALLGR